MFDRVWVALDFGFPTFLTCLLNIIFNMMKHPLPVKENYTLVSNNYSKSLYIKYIELHLSLR